MHITCREVETTLTTQLLIVRHAASHHKETGTIGGPIGCRGLTEVGRRQSAALANRFLNELLRPVKAIYSSTITRAIETASIIANALGQRDVYQDCGLCTWHTPTEVDGMLWSEYQSSSTLVGGGAYRPFQRGNETWAELIARTGQALDTICSRHVGELTIVVTHAEVVQSSLTLFGGLPLSPSFDLRIAPTGITEWLTIGDPDSWPRPRWTLERLNDSSHLRA